MRSSVGQECPRSKMMLGWMSGHTRKDTIKNKFIRAEIDKVGVTSVMLKMREARLGWFRHVQRRFKDALVRRCEMLTIVGVYWKLTTSLSCKGRSLSYSTYEITLSMLLFKVKLI